MDSVRPQKHAADMSVATLFYERLKVWLKKEVRVHTRKHPKQLYDDGFGILWQSMKIYREPNWDVYREMCGNDGIWDARKRFYTCLCQN